MFSLGADASKVRSRDTVASKDSASKRFSILSRAYNSMSLKGTKSREPSPKVFQKADRKDADTPALASFSGMFDAPAAGARPKPPAELDERQEAKLAEMLRYFRAREAYPISLKGEGADEVPLSDWEKLRMLSRESMLRYLRATKWDVAQAKKRLAETIAWRREFGVDYIKADVVEPEARSGKETILGFDNCARPLHYIHPHRNETKETPMQIQFAVWILERCIDLMPPGVEQLVLLINFDGKLCNPTSISNAKLMLYILQNHYVERLGVALCINVPWVFKAFWNAIQPFMDPVTKSKCKFDEDVKNDIPSEQLSAEFGGSVHPRYQHERYWDELVKLCDTRREKMLQRFKEQCRSDIGASEWVIRGGNDKKFNSMALKGQDVRSKAQEAPNRAAMVRTASKRPAGTVTTQITDLEGAKDGLEAREVAVQASNGRAAAAKTAVANGTTASQCYVTNTSKVLPNGHIDDTDPALRDAQNGAGATPMETFQTPSANLTRDPIDCRFSPSLNSVDTDAVALRAGRPAQVGGRKGQNAQQADKKHQNGQAFSTFTSKVVHHDGEVLDPVSSKGSITLLLFAAARDAAGKSSFILDLPQSPFPLTDLASLLPAAGLKDSSRFNVVLKRSQWSVGQSMVREDEVSKTMLKGGEEVAIIPPVSGG